MKKAPTMKLFAYICLLSFYLCTTPIMTNHLQNTPNDFWKKTIISISYGSTCGAITGYSNALVLNKISKKSIPTILLSWLIFSSARQEIVKIITQGLEENTIPHNKGLAHWTAWLTDWLVYVYTLKNV